MSQLDPALFALLGVGAGVLIGCVGVGGVIVVPALVYLFGFPVDVAVAAAMFAFLLSGVVGTAVFAREGSIRWDMTGWMWAGAMPAAFAGALAANLWPSRWVEGMVALLAAASGIHALLGSRGPGPERTAPLPRPVLAAVGAVTGFVSALTGTGGPLVLIPMLVWMNLSALTAIGLAQAIQLPIAVLASGGNALAGSLDIRLGALIGLGIVAGTWAGARLAHSLPRETLRTAVAALLVAVGASMIGGLLVGR
ncbi:MAG: sulfite exporter TauE/SafE family protein [Gammaproteobacteria bacterium]|nr:sulfite exporter TauE/SafE family protein [Gammaproteobacteria bacterium]